MLIQKYVHPDGSSYDHLHASSFSNL
jgi:hypothetical protein